MAILELMLNVWDSGLTVSRYVCNFDVWAMEQESLADLCTCGVPRPEQAMVCSNCDLSARCSLGSAWAVAYDAGMSVGAKESA